MRTTSRESSMRRKADQEPIAPADHHRSIAPMASRRQLAARPAQQAGGSHEDPYRLEGLDRVVAILDLLGTGNNSMSLAEICQQMDLRKSTAHRALMALERTGMIERAPGNRYRLGLKLYDMGSRAVEQIDLRSWIHPHLRKLALRVGETVHLGVLHRDRVVYIDKIEPINRRVCLSSRTGTSNPVYSTSLGKAILAFLPEDEVARTLQGVVFACFTSKTLSSRKELLDALERVRRRGYSIDDEEMEIGTRCVGAPILNESGRAIAAVSVSGASIRLAAHCVPSIAEHVMRCAQEISTALQAHEARRARAAAL
ncbi:MAG TPA: IclR family transcriptional regulator [Terracidiphilus sp.]|nr:IclR family transcriptional regulator [Terracidiphilus sp.]